MIWNRLKRILFHLFSVLQLEDLSYLLNAIPSHHHLRKPLSPTPFSPVGRKRVLFKKSCLDLQMLSPPCKFTGSEQNHINQWTTVSNWKKSSLWINQAIPQKVSAHAIIGLQKANPLNFKGKIKIKIIRNWRQLPLHNTILPRIFRSSKNNFVSCNTFFFVHHLFKRPLEGTVDSSEVLLGGWGLVVIIMYTEFHTPQPDFWTINRFIAFIWNTLLYLVSSRYCFLDPPNQRSHKDKPPKVPNLKFPQKLYKLGRIWVNLRSPGQEVPMFNAGGCFTWDN